MLCVQHWRLRRQAQKGRRRGCNPPTHSYTHFQTPLVSSNSSSSEVLLAPRKARGFSCLSFPRRGPPNTTEDTRPTIPNNDTKLQPESPKPPPHFTLAAHSHVHSPSQTPHPLPPPHHPSTQTPHPSHCPSYHLYDDGPPNHPIHPHTPSQPRHPL